MDSSKQVLLVGTGAVIIAAITGVIVTSQQPKSAEPPAPRTIAIPAPSVQREKPVDDKDEEWKARLTAEQFEVTRRKGTEPQFTGKYWNHKGHGVYMCVCCKCLSLLQVPSLTRGRAGPVSISPSRKRQSKPKWTPVF